MEHVVGILFFLLGLAMGSFFNVCIDRLPRNESIVGPSSYCEACGHRLSRLDLIPVISYLVLRGRCRYCQAKIPSRLVLVEIVTGLLFLLFWYYYGLSREFAFSLIYASFFVVIFFIDIKHYLVLNKVIYPAIAIALIIAGATQYYDIAAPLLGGLTGAGSLFIVALISKGGMGMGDVKLGAFIGVIVGYPQAFVFLLISVIAGGVFATGLLLVKRKGRKEAIPFAPFLVTGGIITMLYGSGVLDFLLNGWYVV
jgi:leader peptidase (prepilin peptidase)/N-methyltransferase